MALEIYDVPESRSSIGKEKTATAKYVITGTKDYATAEAYALAQVPVIDFGLILEKIDIREIEDERDGSWEVTAHYKRPEFETGSGSSSIPVPREKGFTFEITSATSKVTHSLETVSTYFIGTAGEEPPDFNQAINVRDGKPEGVDVYVAETSFTIEVEVYAWMLTNAVIQSIEEKAATVNNATFRGRAAGEVLFEGLRGAVDYDEPVSSLNYSFKVQKNMTGGDIGPFTGVDKEGWDYAWIYSEQVEVDGVVFEQAKLLSIERVHERSNFGDLGVLP